MIRRHLIRHVRRLSTSATEMVWLLNKSNDKHEHKETVFSTSDEYDEYMQSGKPKEE